jgi:hypothetical protein
MADEIIDDDISELEIEDDALEKRVKKLEAESARLLNHSNELIKSMLKDKAKPEDVPPGEALSAVSEPKGAEE